MTEEASFMESQPITPLNQAVPPTRHGHRHRPMWRLAALPVVLVFAYVFLAYVAMPLFWLGYVEAHPSLDDMPRITHTRDGVPGDPLNVALIGTEAELEKILTAAGWFPADPLDLRSDLKIAEATVLKRPYDDAPVSRLYLFGRPENIAYEKPVGNNPRERHHVRWWKTAEPVDDGRTLWIGSATFDRDVGFSHTTGQITHHIAADVDVQRGELFEDLERTGLLAENWFVDNFHKKLSGKNGGGDPWHTDGRLQAGVIKDEHHLAP